MQREPEQEHRARRHRQEPERARSRRRAQRVGQVGTDHQELAVRDVHDAEQPVLQIETDRDQRVDTAGDEAGDREVREERYFHAGFGKTGAAVARSLGHTTSNSPFSHWPIVPGVVMFSLPWKRIGPTTVWNSVTAT